MSSRTQEENPCYWVLAKDFANKTPNKNLNRRTGEGGTLTI